MQKILRKEEAIERLLFSYELMLDFYGIQISEKGNVNLSSNVLKSKSWTFSPGKLEPTPNCEKRFQNLNRSSHNYLRITRILKCLGEFGLEDLKAPFIKFMLREAITTGRLRNILNSCMCYWVEVLKDEEERKEMWRLAGEMVAEVNAQGRSQPPTMVTPVQRGQPVFRSTQKKILLEKYGKGGKTTEMKEGPRGTGTATEATHGTVTGTETKVSHGIETGRGTVQTGKRPPHKSQTGQSGVEDGGEVEGFVGANGCGGKIRVEDGKGEAKTPATSSLDGKHNGDQGESKEGNGDGDREGEEGKEEVGEEEQGGGGAGNSGGGEGGKVSADNKMGEEKVNGENKDKGTMNTTLTNYPSN